MENLNRSIMIAFTLGLFFGLVIAAIMIVAAVINYAKELNEEIK